MRDLNWFDSYKIGDPLIDSDHLKLFTEVNNLKKCIEDGSPQKELKKFLEFLYNYVGVHFAREEDLMRKVHYPKYSQHRALHNLHSRT